jgi:hypothetical protein
MSQSGSVRLKDDNPVPADRDIQLELYRNARKASEFASNVARIASEEVNFSVKDIGSRVYAAIVEATPGLAADRDLTNWASMFGSSDIDQYHSLEDDDDYSSEEEKYETRIESDLSSNDMPSNNMSLWSSVTKIFQ